MKLPRYIIVIVVVLLVVFLPRCANAVIKMKQESDLARELGIEVGDYPATSPFPMNYFLVVLKPGATTIAEVHDIVKGYEQVQWLSPYINQRK